MRNILFLCTGNSARSIMAEGYMNHAGTKAWRAFSAGSTPTGEVNPFALETLRAHGVAIAEEDARSKSWDEFAGAGAPLMDAVVTVCDNAAGETCPVWPAKNGAAPHKLHWSFPDPAAAGGSDNAKREAFEKVFADIRAHIDAFLAQSND
ncbi:arsenate reductase ArsC [Hyphococcus luteus]|uniref:Protein-tyrosine-phosphatase n=1 Tax=Hyphococcus luteus TaxID=2058213 RepID=A0A2S7K6B2_9PROT|nr:arsenate reductase ArsC [Marinicaulis flavus]PQA87998.1 protein-tyrosine-phosphatase [Marinicaulis flavus]